MQNSALKNNKNLHRLLFWLILAAGIFARVWRFGAVPGGINQDEAFAAYEAYLSGVSPECREASSETAETHSTAMELLTMPWHGLFFGKERPAVFFRNVFFNEIHHFFE